MIRFIETVGYGFESACLTAGRALTLTADTARALPHVRRRWPEIIQQTFRASYGSLPVTFLTALFTGMILAFQTGIELEKYGQQSSIGYIVAASMCREMGPVMTAIALAGLMGSSYAAEIGTMRVSEEIDALQVMSIDPVRFLVMPRVVALVAASFALTLYVDVVGILGGALVGKANFGVSIDTYLKNAQDILEWKDVWIGILKGLTFGLVTAVIGCNEGLTTGEGAQGVGRATQKTVVLSFISILVLDHLINYLTNLVDRGIESL